MRGALLSTVYLTLISRSVMFKNTESLLPKKSNINGAPGRGSGRPRRELEPAAGSGPTPAARGEARRGGAGSDGKGRPRGSGAASRQPGCGLQRSCTESAMGLETEKADMQLFMDDDSYSHHSGLEYANPEKFVDSGQDRDSHRLNSHLSRIIMPFVKTCLMVLPSMQTIWKSVTDAIIAPLCTSIGRSFSSVSLQLSQD
uniref:Caveolin n=1 Tax=Callithrix jacchus TaxID=9483 RepID=A0A8I4A152_CALJA